jgi:glutamate 5-kinase
MGKKASELIQESRKIVFKFGSGTLALPDSGEREGGEDESIIDTDYIHSFAGQCAALLKAGKQAVIVSSGAQAAGLSTMLKWSRKRDIHYRQALCAVGQVELMKAWSDAFAAVGYHVAQILLTREDFKDNTRTLNMRNTLFTLVDEGIIPIINENDTVGVDEIKIGDNDTLAAQSAILWSADLLVLFSDIDGLYTANPKTDKTAAYIEEVRDFKSLKKLVNTKNSDTSTLGTGGISTKIEAAKIVSKYGIPTIITHGRPTPIDTLFSENQRGTIIY